MNKRIAAVSVLLLGVIGTGSAMPQEVLPKGWRNLRAAELSDALRKDSPSRYATVVADLNGDGNEDRAVLLRSTNSQREALWVWLSAKDGTFQWQKLGEYPASPNSDSGMGIAASNPGVHPYGCFCNSKDCNLGDHKDRPKLRLRDPALEHFKIESAASMFFWSHSQKRFLCVVLSD